MGIVPGVDTPVCVMSSQRDYRLSEASNNLGEIKIIRDKKVMKETEFYKIVNADGKCWLMPMRNVRMGLALYQPSGWKGRLLKRWFPYVHWSKVVRRKLNIEVVEHVLEEDLKRVIGSAFGVGGFEYSVFELH